MPIINTTAPPSLERYEIEYDKDLFYNGAYPQPSIYKENNGICHFYCVIYPKNGTNVKLDQYILTTLPEEYKAKYWFSLPCLVKGVPKVSGNLTRVAFSVQPNPEDGTIRLYFDDEYFSKISQLIIQGTWITDN